MSNQPYYHPYDPSASAQGSQSSRSNYPQPVYGQYNQPTYGQMGYADMSQSGHRYSQAPLQYPHSADGGQYVNHDGYPEPSFSPTAATFAQSHSYDTPANADTMTYRRRYQSTGGVYPPQHREPMPRHPSGELPMASMHDGQEFVPVPSQPFEPNVPVARPVASPRSSSVGQSSTTSALALEKPYVCDICHTRFARHHDCRRHRETHVVNASGEKPHHCVVCGKSFTRKDALKRHTNQKGCDINAASSTPARSSRSSSSASPQQSPATFYPVSGLPHGSGSSQYY